MAMHDCAWVVCIRCMGAMAIGKKDPRPSSRNDIPLNYPHRWPREGDLTRWVAPETSRARLVLLYIHSHTHTHPRPRATHASDHRRPGLAAAPPPRPPARPGPAPQARKAPGVSPGGQSLRRPCGAATGAGRGNPVQPWRGRPQGSRRRRGCGGAWSGSDQEDEQGDGEDDTQGDADQHASTHARSTGSPDPVGRSAS
jgi:hypothetical protein